MQDEVFLARFFWRIGYGLILSLIAPFLVFGVVLEMVAIVTYERRYFAGGDLQGLVFKRLIRMVYETTVKWHNGVWTDGRFFVRLLCFVGAFVFVGSNFGIDTWAFSFHFLPCAILAQFSFIFFIAVIRRGQRSTLRSLWEGDSWDTEADVLSKIPFAEKSIKLLVIVRDIFMPFTVFVRLIINFAVMELIGSASGMFYAANTKLLENRNEVFRLVGLVMLLFYVSLWAVYFRAEIWRISVQFIVFSYLFGQVIEAAVRGAGVRRRTLKRVCQEKVIISRLKVNDGNYSSIV